MNIIVEPSFDTPLVSFAVLGLRGAACDPPGQEGLVGHVVELSTRGAAGLSRLEFDEAVDVLGASLGYLIRRDYVVMRGGCLQRHLDSLVELGRLSLEAPTFPQEEHDKLLRETHYELEELRDDDASLAQRFFTAYIRPGYAYSRSAVGTEASLRNISDAPIADFHKALFAADEVVFGFAGALDEKQAEALARTFAKRSGPGLAAPDLSLPPVAPGSRLLFVDKPERKQAQVIMGHHVPPYSHHHFDALRVAECAFGGVFTSRLMQEIRVKNGWSYGASCSLGQARGAQPISIGIAPANEVARPAIARCLEMFTELASDGLSLEEFEFARSYLQGSAAFERATVNQRLMRKLRDLAFSLPSGYSDAFEQRIGSLSVNEVNAALSAHLKPRDLFTVVVGSASELLADLEGLPFDSIDVVDHASY